jgi:hypothetical protein
LHYDFINWPIEVTEGERVVLTLFGAAVVTCMMLFYALEGRSPWFTFAFAVACLGSSTYGWLAGTWPFGIVEAMWALIAFKKWYQLRTTTTTSSLVDRVCAKLDAVSGDGVTS